MVYYCGNMTLLAGGFSSTNNNKQIAYNQSEQRNMTYTLSLVEAGKTWLPGHKQSQMTAQCVTPDRTAG